MPAVLSTHLSSRLLASSGWITLRGFSTWELPLWQHTSCFTAHSQVELSSQELGEGLWKWWRNHAGPFCSAQLSHKHAKCHARPEEWKAGGSGASPTFKGVCSIYDDAFQSGHKHSPPSLNLPEIRTDLGRTSHTLFWSHAHAGKTNTALFIFARSCDCSRGDSMKLKIETKHEEMLERATWKYRWFNTTEHPAYLLSYSLMLMHMCLPSTCADWGPVVEYSAMKNTAWMQKGNENLQVNPAGGGSYQRATVFLRGSPWNSVFGWSPV